MGPHTAVQAILATATLSDSVAAHPLAYFISAGAMIAVGLYVIFAKDSGLSQSIGWALFASPLSLTVVAVAIGVALDQQLPVIISDNGITLGTYTPYDLALYAGIGAGVCTWILLMSRWVAKRAHRRRRAIPRERPLNAETVARVEAADSFGKRHEQPSPHPRMPRRR